MSEDAKQPTVYLSLDQILGADDLEERDVEVSAWGGRVRVRALSRASVRKIYQDATDRAGVIDSEKVERALVCMGMVNPVVSPAAYARLDAKLSGAVQQLIGAIMQVSGMTPDALDQAASSFRGQP